MSTAFHHGFRDARASLGAQPLSSLGLGVVVVVLLGIVQGQTIQSADGVRRVEQLLLGGVTFGILLPLASFALSGSAEVGSEALGRATWARYGANRRAYALGRIACGAAMIAAGAFGVGALALGLSLASGAAGGGPSEGPGLGAVALAAALGAASYSAGLALAHRLGGRWMQVAFLVVDWLFGAGEGLLAVPWPRAHIGALLGDAPVLAMSPGQSAETLLLLTLAFALAFASRTPR